MEFFHSNGKIGFFRRFWSVNHIILIHIINRYLQAPRHLRKIRTPSGPFSKICANLFITSLFPYQSTSQVGGRYYLGLFVVS